MEFFYAVGPEIVHTSKGATQHFSWFKIAWYPKYSQISHVRTGDLRVDMVTVHAASGVEMMPDQRQLGEEQIGGRDPVDFYQCFIKQQSRICSLIMRQGQAKAWTGLSTLSPWSNDARMPLHQTCLCHARDSTSRSWSGGQKRAIFATRSGSDYIVVGHVQSSKQKTHRTLTMKLKRQWNS